MLLRGILGSFILIISLNIHINAQNRQISGGHRYSLVLCENGNLYGAGDNLDGQIAISSATSFNQWTQVPGVPTDLVMADAGTSSHALAIDCNGKVWSWGNNIYGQTGIGNPISLLAGSYTSDTPIAPPHTVPGIGDYLPPAVFVTGGDGNSYAITSVTGNVLAWGRNDIGLLGNGTYVYTVTSFQTIPSYVLTGPGQLLKDIVLIEAGDLDCYALDKNGFVWSWGENGNWSLGIGDSVGYAVSGYAQKVLADYNGDGVSDGPLQNIVIMSGGDTHGIAIDVNGTAWSWGGNWGPGQLGNYNGIDSPLAVKVSVANDTLLKDINYSYIHKSPTVLQKSNYTSAGQASSLFLLQDTRIAVTGANGIYENGSYWANDGTLGNGNIASLTLGGESFTVRPGYVRTGPNTYLSGIQKLADGDAHYFAVDTNNVIYGWGYNQSGSLGIGNNQDVGYAVQIALPNGCTLKRICPYYLQLLSSVDANGNLVLSSNQSENDYGYNWYYKNLTLGSQWELVSQGTGIKYKTLTANSPGWYKLAINSSITGSNCATCNVVQDSIQITVDCSKLLNLGADQTLCAPFDYMLKSTLLGSNFNYTWSFKNDASSNWNILPSSGIGTIYASIDASQAGYYKLQIQIPNCPNQSDSVQITAQKPITTLPSPTSNYCPAQSIANFIVTSTGNNIYWYSDTTLASILNPGAPARMFTSTAPGLLGTGNNCYGKQVYIKDANTLTGYIWKSISTSCGIGSTYSTYPEGFGYEINVTQPLKIDSISVVVSTPYNISNTSIALNIFNISSVSSGFCAFCTGSGIYYNSTGNFLTGSPFTTVTIPLNTLTTVRVPVNIELNPGKYWMNLTTTGALYFYNFTCSPAFAPYSQYWASPETDNLGINSLQITTMQEYTLINTNLGRGFIYDIQYSTIAPSVCNFYPVCATTEFIGKPASIQSPQQYCPTDSLVINVSTVSGAIGYQWSFPPGSTIVSTLGPTATVVGGAQSGQITATPYGTCNSGTGISINYSGSGSGNSICVPPPPITISGLANVVAGQTSVTYIAPYFNGYTYQWTLPAGATGTTNAQQNTITVDFGNTSGNVSLTISNKYGSTNSFILVNVGTVTQLDATSLGAWGIYPNPTKSSVTILNGASIGFDHFEVLNLGGQPITSGILNSNGQIDLPGETSSGMYLLKLISPYGVSIKRFVVENDSF